MMTEEKVHVLLIVSHINLEGSQLHPSLRRHTCRTGFLLRCNQLQTQFAELHIGAHTEERTCPLDQGRV